MSAWSGDRVERCLDMSPEKVNFLSAGIQALTVFCASDMCSGIHSLPRDLLHWKETVGQLSLEL